MAVSVTFVRCLCGCGRLVGDDETALDIIGQRVRACRPTLERAARPMAITLTKGERALVEMWGVNMAVQDREDGTS